MLLREELADAVELPVPAWRPSMVPLPAALLSESCLSCLSCSCFCLRICESRFSKPLSCVGGHRHQAGPVRLAHGIACARAHTTDAGIGMRA